MQRVPTIAVKRHGTFATAVTNGVDPSTVVLAESDLEKWSKLCSKSKDANDNVEQTNLVNSARQAVSNDKKSRWNDTVDGKLAAKKQRMAAKEAEDERRRVVLDNEEEALRSARTQMQYNTAVEKIVDRDPRVQNMQSQYLLQSVIDERVGQVNEKKAAAERRVHDSERFHLQSLDSARKATAVEEEKTMSARARAKDTREAHVQQVADQRKTLLERREAQNAEGRRLRAAAEDEVKSAREKHVQVKTAAKEIQTARLKQWSESDQALNTPVQARRMKLDAMRLEGDSPSKARQSEEQYVEMKVRQHEAWAKSNELKYDKTQQRIADATEILQASSPHVTPRETARVKMALGKSVADRCADDEDERYLVSKQGEAVYVAGLDRDMRRTAAVKARAADVEAARRVRVAATLEQQRRMDEAEDRDRRAENVRQQEFLRLQVREKQLQAQHDRRAEERDAAAIMTGQRDGEQAMTDYLAQQINGMHLSPALHFRASHAKSGDNVVPHRHHVRAQE